MSMFSRCDKYMDSDPFEEIFALNLGDFLTEHLISKDLATEIKKKIKSEPNGIRSQLKELISIYSIDNTLDLLGFKNNDEYVIYNAIAKTVIEMLEVNACYIFLSKDQVKGNISKELFLSGSSDDMCKRGYSYNIGYNLDEENVIVKAFNNREIISKNINDADFEKVFDFCKGSTLKSADIFPICNNQICVGVIVIGNTKEKNISPNYADLLKTVSSLFTTSLQVQTLTEEASVLINDESVRLSTLKHIRAELTVLIGDMGDEQQRFVEKLAETVDIKSSNKNKHSKNTANIALKISEELKLNEKTKDLIYYAALLQNIGKIVLPEELFNKKGKLTQKEIDELNKSPNIGVSILMKINFLSEIIPYINYMKERWDGHGSPNGLSGLSIPFGSRIIAVADAYCALRESRSFREGMDDDKAMDIIKEESGQKWDPIVVEALTKIDRTMTV